MTDMTNFLNGPNAADIEAPVVKMGWVEYLSEETGVPGDYCHRFLEMVEHHNGDRRAIIADWRHEIGLSRALELVAKLTPYSSYLYQQAAHADGKLWTIRAAIKPDNVFIVIQHGFDTLGDALDTQHPDAVGFAETTVIGDRKDALLAAASLLVTKELTIRFVGNDGTGRIADLPRA